MASLLIDTNFFIDCLRCGIPLDEVERFGEVFVPENVVREMDGLTLRGKEEVLRKIVREWVKKYEIYPLHGRVDESLIELAKKERIIVATNDSKLKKSLKRFGSDVVFIRSRNHLEIF
jgi:rRNA-processing protein FCF1